MARKPRIHYRGALYHVMLRGNDGQKIFFSKADRRYCYALLEEGIKRYGHRLHGFCLMGNHIHLALQVGDVPLSRSLHNLSFRYTRYLNKSRGRAGHLFQGRYQALLVEAETYLLSLIRYIHRNPVKARLVRTPEAYPWSAHRAYLGRERLPWLTTDWVLSKFAERRATAVRRYARFILEADDADYEKALKAQAVEGRLLGTDRFIEKTLRTTQTPRVKVSLDDIMEHISRAYNIQKHTLALPGKDRLRAEARAVAAWLVRETPTLSLTAFSQKVRRDVTTLSAAVTRLLARAEDDSRLKARLRKLQAAAFKHNSKPEHPA